MSKQKKMFCYLPTTAISGSCLWRHLGCSRTRFWWLCCHWLRGIRYWSADWSKMWLLLLFQGAYKKENTHVTHAHVRGKSSMLWKQIRGEAITATIWFDNSWITQDYYVVKLQTPAVIIQMNQLFSLHRDVFYRVQYLLMSPDVLPIILDFKIWMFKITGIK